MTIETARIPGTTPTSAVPRSPFGGTRVLAGTVRVQLAGSRQHHVVDVGALQVNAGDHVVVKTLDGDAVAKVQTQVERRVIAAASTSRVLRVATADDMAAWTRRNTAGDTAMRATVRVLRRLRTPVKIIQAFVPLGGGKTVIYYASEDRVDVRKLARELASAINGRVELRPISVREGAGVIGGLGPCGQTLCCSTFLTQFASVSIRHAKDQGISLHPHRVTGMCGRLKCCLVYEVSAYKEMKRFAPRKRNGVYTAQGAGTVLDVDVINRKVFVRLAGAGMEWFHVRDVTVVDRPLTQDELDAGGPSREAAILNARKRRRGDSTGKMSRQAATVLSEDYIWDDTESKAEISETAAVEAPGSVGKRRRNKRPDGGGNSGGSRNSRSRSGGKKKDSSRKPKPASAENQPPKAADGAPATDAPKRKRRRGGRGRRGGGGGGGGGGENNSGGNSGGGNSGGGNSGGGGSGGGNSGGGNSGGGNSGGGAAE